MSGTDQSSGIFTKFFLLVFFGDDVDFVAAGCTLLVVGMVQLSVASGVQTSLRRSWVRTSGAGAHVPLTWVLF